MVLNLRRIEVFLAVARDLHFTKAAQRLNLAQPAVSRAIGSLEADLGVPLLERSTRNVELTQAGRLFRAECREALDRLERAVRQARAAGQGEAGVLRIGYMEFALAGVLPRVLKAFRSRHPGVTVEPRWSGTDRIQAELRSGEIDVGFVIGPVEQPGLASLPVQNDRFVAVLPDSHPLAGKAEVRLSDLADEPMIMGRRDLWAPYLRRVEALCHKAGFALNVVQEAENTDSIFAFVAAGMGATIHVERARGHHPPGIAIRHLADVQQTIRTEATWRAGDDSPLVRRFVAVIGDVVGVG